MLKNISVRLAAFELNLEAELKGRISVIFGPSGSGKTSLLELIAGLRRAESGLIESEGIILADSAKNFFLPARLRRIGYVPQDLALFPHLSVRKNLEYGFKKNEAAKVLPHFLRVVEVLEIGGLIERTISRLSGGEKQRVALARALLSSPQLLLLDEPLANLDTPLKSRILPYLTRMRDEFHIPMLYVTHDEQELLALADEMLVLIDGKIAQQGSVSEVFGRPANLAVASLLKIETVCPGRIKQLQNELAIVSVGNVTLFALAENISANVTDVHVCIHAEDVILTTHAVEASSARNQLAAVVRSVEPAGTRMRIELDCGFNLVAQLTRQACEDLELKPGGKMFAMIKAPHIHLIAR